MLWTKTFQVKYQHTGAAEGELVPLVDNDGNIITFNANFDKDTAVTNTFPYVILTKRIRIYPTKWNKNRAALRVEFIGW